MFPVLELGAVRTYNLFLLGGILCGWVFFLIDEYRAVIADQSRDSPWLFLRTSLLYFVIVLFCIQGANYFHYFFDNIPERVKASLTLKDMILTPFIGTSKVLYGAVFFYPLGVFAATLTIKKISFHSYLNQKTFVLFSILGFARMGCFSNGCCYGIQSNTLGMSFPSGSVAATEHYLRGGTRGFIALPSPAVIPTQLISAAFLFTVAILSWRAFRQDPRQPVFLKYLFVYALFRFSIEFIRNDLERAYWSFLSASQWISLVIMTGFAVLFVVKKILVKRDGA
jgi:phosphatidylglycerol---prolipoprotein diacylglyceryl transferase